VSRGCLRRAQHETRACELYRISVAVVVAVVVVVVVVFVVMLMLEEFAAAGAPPPWHIFGISSCYEIIFKRARCRLPGHPGGSGASRGGPFPAPLPLPNNRGPLPGRQKIGSAGPLTPRSKTRRHAASEPRLTM
jgi:hypothetical protein